MVRYGSNPEVYNLITGGFDDFAGHRFAYNPVLTEKYLLFLFPIPAREINNNKNLTQNPGW